MAVVDICMDITRITTPDGFYETMIGLLLVLALVFLVYILAIYFGIAPGNVLVDSTVTNPIGI